MTRLGLILLTLASSFVLAEPTLSSQSAPQVSEVEVPRPKAGRARPLVAIVADNAGTETTDLIVPYGVLKQANVADVIIVSSKPGPVTLMPALSIEADMTIVDFDRGYKEGADIVVIPALHDSENEAIVAWVSRQYRNGAFIMAICEGAWVAAKAGILDGRQATTHWYAMDKIEARYPKAIWVENRRYVVDRNVMTTTGVTASMPASLALVEGIAGERTASETAAHFGITAPGRLPWSPDHESASFHLTSGKIGLIIWNYLTFWRHQTIEVPVFPGINEVALALVADAWSRTYRSKVVATSFAASVRTHHGLHLIPDRTPAAEADLTISKAPALGQFDQTLDEIEKRYGKRTREIVALQLEYEK
ncbi:putative intracellular protease/amidase [Peteryoungia aggregata LMG 23059]|uniref:Intracellular protease/amidase n=1 Tax=Peteryoungia aggregata LMG 23059 TaxID=1368425 RepID=A0ABU0G3S9_9HYPH|nr:DJ-1/PfpI family protein [Peteryoungia aggregata]MDQ0419985.1 putative intracellular protease/amidase [Peteryoungia aggregata LMG 23059]